MERAFKGMGAAQGNALGKESGCPVEEIFLKSIFIYLLAALPPGIKPVTPAGSVEY